MTHRAAHLILPLWLLVAAASPVRSESPTTPLALATAFCDAVRSGDERAAEALMTAELQTAIATLRAADARFRSAHPDEKPPLGDGLPLAGFPDVPETCTPSELSATSARLTYVPAGAADGAWSDRLILSAQPDGTLRIADILYAPDGARGFRAWLAEAATWD